MPAPKGWDTNPSGGLAVNPLVGWDLIGTTDGANAVVRLVFATSEAERKAVQLVIATPAFRELAETFIRFADKLEATGAAKSPRPMN
jgi:hypothetical protein